MTAVTKKVAKKLHELQAIFSKRKLTDEDVHGARQKIKKLRALIKLIRTPLGKKHYQRYNHTLREIGQALGTARDASVLPATLEKLLAQETAKRKTSLRPVLDQLLQHSAAIVVDSKATLQPRQQQEKLQQLVDDIEKWPKLSSDFTVFAKDLNKTYAMGRTLLEENASNSSSTKRHELRKQVKNLRYQIHYLRSAWPEYQKMLEKSLHELSDLLGDDHDLTELSKWVDNTDSNLSALQSRTLRNLIQRRQDQLQQQALRLGSYIYAENPPHFCRRQQAYWQLHSKYAAAASKTSRKPNEKGKTNRY